MEKQAEGNRNNAYESRGEEQDTNQARPTSSGAKLNSCRPQTSPETTVLYTHAGTCKHVSLGGFLAMLDEETPGRDFIQKHGKLEIAQSEQDVSPFCKESDMTYS